ncbi:hypothetical protein PUNSTDRAFT_146031 [Punctularia strigosozonata HHB-11173 SS5]|uniref:Uncharacterized protein n=1 Tax=Punctularia strigosozonata (strain HHB-11173) TaxID=741275 RepID=R7S405_PUNST|nr:uncharacterized protein PUNSTDRAFT_146031 [Punctularia strigosozonata HHB-11173 SS5]EIN05115.1 hypothetical protein PUNSTDRAFT_146031 [Punctularia strigosozonata HHB-11173 SS5]
MIALLDHLATTGEENGILVFDRQSLSVMLVIFAQAHLPITAMHLSRLAISALHDPRTAPRSWTELFWLADRNWQNPVSLGLLVMPMVKSRVLPSPTFAIFSLTCLLATITPITMSRAWPAQSESMTVNGTITANCSSLDKLGQVDPKSQLSVGVALCTGQTEGADIQAYYNENSDDEFFSGSGSVYGLNVTSIPGFLLRNQGCFPMKGASRPASNSDDDLKRWCDGTGLNETWHSSTLNGSNGIVLHMSWCSNFYANASYNARWMSEPNASATAAIAVTATNGGSPLVSGLIRCDLSISSGTADVVYQSFYDAAFRKFQHHPPTDAASVQSDVPYHPLYAALYYITQLGGNNGSADTTLNQLNIGIDDEDYDYTPNIDDVASAIDSVAYCMAGSLASLSEAPVHLNYTMLESLDIVQWRRKPRYIVATLISIAGWFLLLVYSTVKMYRPTFGGSLNSYVAARLLADSPELVEGHCCGELKSNPKLHAPFGCVADVRADEPVGHIGVVASKEPRCALDRKRREYSLTILQITTQGLIIKHFHNVSALLSGMRAAI